VTDLLVAILKTRASVRFYAVGSVPCITLEKRKQTLVYILRIVTFRFRTGPLLSKIYESFANNDIPYVYPFHARCQFEGAKNKI
jgi:hypothetical protein